MNTDDTLRRLIHREMRAHFAWHRIEKFEHEGNGYSIVVSVQPNPRAYAAAADLTTALKRHYREVHLNKTASYLTINQNGIYSMCIICHSPKVVSMPVMKSRAA